MTRLLQLAVLSAICAGGAMGLAPVVLAQAPAPGTSVPASGAPAPAPTELPPPPPGEARVTPLGSTESCDGFWRDPGFRLGQDQVIRKGQAVDSFAVVLGSVVVEGQVCGDLSVTLGDVRLASGATVEGSLVVVGGTVTIEPGAVVGHELVLVGGVLDAPATFRPGREQVVIGIPVVGARVRDAIPYLTRGLLLGRLIVPELGWVWIVVGVVFFVQLVLNLLFPQAIAASADVIAERPLSTFLAGALVLVLSGPVATLLAVTVVGIAALPVLFGALLVAWVVGKIAVNRWIGARLFEQEDPASRLASTRSFVIGFAVVTMAYMIPLVGLVVWGLTGVLGLGGAALAFVRGFRRENPPPVPTPRPTPPVPPASPLSPPPSPPPFDAAPVALADPFALPPPAFAGDVPPMPHAMPAASAVDPRALLAFPRAGFGERAAAFVLDVVLVAMTAAMLGSDDPGDWFVLALVAYHVGFWVWKATTLGGIICQLRVVRVDGAPLRFVDALVRGLVGIFSIATFGLGALWILRDPERQSWHDKVAGTFVVRVPRNYPLS